MRKLLNALCTMCLVSISSAQVYTTYHWHMQQPIYWPDRSSSNSNTYEKAWESIQHTNAGASHPENNLQNIFGWADRVAAYQYRMRDSIASMSGNDSGAQVSYGGCLVENVASLGENYALGYSPAWNSSINQARGWNTSGGFPRLDMVIFPYHHSLAPLVDEAALRMEIRIAREIYADAWGSNPASSVGFFPPELAFSERMIQILVEEGIEWTFVPNNHVSRACENFPMVYGSGGENCDPPNPADQINPSQSSWFSQTIDRGCTPTNAYPFSYRPHKAKYINPDTGTEYKITVVPVAQAMSWEDGYQSIGLDMVNQIAASSQPEQPLLIVHAHDGDNAWGGGYSYYQESVPNFTSQAVSAGYTPTVVQQYLNDHPVSASDVIHVEDGAWVNADGDFGSPDFINWNWPLVGMDGSFDIPTGWAEDERNWAVITAAQNRVLTAEQLSGGVSAASVQDPVNNGASDAELAWHFFLPALTSGYMYYGNALDMEVKASVACNEAVSHADQVIGSGSGDTTAPTVWIPQQLPHNPGGIGFGALWNYTQTQMDRDFYIWTFVYDVSGLESVSWKYRIDNDGTNPLDSNQNETYAGGSDVGNWITLPMNVRAFPTDNVYNDPNINFFELPQYIADEYWLHVNEPALVDEGNKLIDYYVEAVDSLGNVKRSPIQHTWIGDGLGNGGGQDSAVNWWPQEPEASQSVTISYDLTLGTLDPTTDPVYIHIGDSGWNNVISPDPQMIFNPDSSYWQYTYTIPGAASSVDFVFNDGGSNWDNNNGQDWHISVTGGAGDGHDWLMDGQLDPQAILLGEDSNRSLWASFQNNYLYLAATPAGSGLDHFIFLAPEIGTMNPAPWTKAGQVSEWTGFLGNEESNGWYGWFDLSGDLAAGTVLEGVLDLHATYGEIPGSIFVAMGAYESPDNGVLQVQLPPSVEGDENIQFAEFYEIGLGAAVPAMVEGVEIAIYGGAALINWDPVTQNTDGETITVDTYKVYYSDEARFSPAEMNLLSETVSTQYFHISALEEGPELYYRIVAVKVD
jgi:hypothetical protein